MEDIKIIYVKFKESYMSEPVTRACFNMTKEEVIKQYDLNASDIEWYEFL